MLRHIRGLGHYQDSADVRSGWEDGCVYSKFDLLAGEFGYAGLVG